MFHYKFFPGFIGQGWRFLSLFFFRKILRLLRECRACRRRRGTYNNNSKNNNHQTTCRFGYYIHYCTYSIFLQVPLQAGQRRLVLLVAVRGAVVGVDGDRYAAAGGQAVGDATDVLAILGTVGWERDFRSLYLRRARACGLPIE